jgi:hypothetical protein
MFNDTIWKLTLPIPSNSKNPKEIYAPFEDVPGVFETIDSGPSSPNGYFRLYCPVSGYTTPGSSYARTEFRELTGDKKLAAWSNKTGAHAMKWTASLEEFPKNKPQVVIGQIHDSKDDVFFIRFTGKTPTTGFLEVCHDSTKYGVLDPELSLSQKFHCSILCTKEQTVITYVKETYTKQITIKKLKVRGGYFKIGNYIQSNTKYDQNGGSKVHLYNAEVVHQAGVLVSEEEFAFLKQVQSNLSQNE